MPFNIDEILTCAVREEEAGNGAHHRTARQHPTRVAVPVSHSPLVSASQTLASGIVSRRERPGTSAGLTGMSLRLPHGICPTMTGVRVGLRGSKRSRLDADTTKIDGPSGAMHEGAVYSLVRSMQEKVRHPDNTTEALLSASASEHYARELESALYERYPSPVGQPSFTDQYRAQLKTLQYNIRGVISKLLQGVTSRDIVHLTCREIADENIQQERDRMYKTYLEAIQQENQVAVACPKCNKVQRNILFNTNLMSLEANNLWSMMFEEEQCTCENEN